MSTVQKFLQWANVVPPCQSFCEDGPVDSQSSVFEPTSEQHPATTPRSPFARFGSAPAKQGMYDPSAERDACGLAMVATLRGTAGHDIITLALDALRNLEHRGAVGSDAGTGDGAGIITQIPDAFLRAVTDFDLPQVGRYAVGNVFLPTDPTSRSTIKRQIGVIAASEGLQILGWREVPGRPDEVGNLARAAMPAIQQLFVQSIHTTETGALVSGIQLDRQTFRLRALEIVGASFMAKAERSRQVA